MNCVNHSDRQQVAFCQHCGRPVCKECVRRTGTAVFCTGCWTPRATTPPPASFTGNPPAGVAGFGPAYPPPVAGEPSPALAALLGFIPGVGAMYNGQYTKGIAHLIVFAMLIALTNQKGFFVIFIVGWTFYMAIEAYHTASAHRDGRPLPDPFGFNQIPEWFGIGKTTWQGFDQHPTSEASSTSVPGATPTSSASGAASTPPFFKNSIVDPMPTSTPFVPYYRRFPSGAVWLILLGTFFLLNNVGLFHFFHTRFFVPILLIGLGVWVFVHRMIESGLGLENDDTDFYRWRFARALHSSFWMVLVGVIWLLDALRILRWSHSWPLFLIAAGVLHLFRHALIGESAGYPPQNNGMPPYSNPSAYSAQAAEGSVTPPGEAGREPSANDPGSQTDSHDGSLGNQEGR